MKRNRTPSSGSRSRLLAATMLGAAIIPALPLLLTPATVRAADVVVAWCGGAVGNWSDSMTWGVMTFECGNFNPVVPNNTVTDNYFIGIDSYDDPLTDPGLDRNGFPLNTAQPSNVHLDVNVTISDLVVGNNDVLTIDNGKSLTIDNVGGGINIYGQIVLDGNGSSTDLKVAGASLTIDQAGSIVLSDSTTNRILGTVNTNRLILVADQELSGTGQIGVNMMKLTNRGVIEANSATGKTLTLDPTDGAGGVVNSGTMKATGNGVLVLQSGTFANFEGGDDGQILADSAVVNINNSTVTGGTLATLGAGEINLTSSTVDGGTVNNSTSGIIRAFGGTSVLGGTLTNATGGQIIIDNNRALRLLSSGTYTNDGDIALNSTGNDTDLSVSGGDVVLGGMGTLTLSDTTANRLLGVAGTDRLILGADQVLTGAGQIGVNQMKLTNHGVVEANSATGKTLTVDPTDGAGAVINSGTMKATGNGVLVFQSGTFENFEGGDGGEILSDSALVNINNSTVTGGTVATLGTGEIRLTSSTVDGGTVNNNGSGIIRALSGTSVLGGTVTNATGGQIIIDNNRALRLLSSGTYANDGDIALNSTGNNTDLSVSGGDVVLGGVGTLTLSDTTVNRLLGVAGTDRLVLGADQVLTGAGQIGVNQMKLTNHGVIDANSATGKTLTINLTGSTHVNTGTLRASDGGKLGLSDAGFTNSGIVEVLGASSQVSAVGSYTQDAGKTRLAGGTLVVGAAANFIGGSLTGSGTVDSGTGGTTFGSGATVSAGDSPGILNFTNSTAFGGLIELEFAGTEVDGGGPDAGIINTATDPGTTQFDQLNVFGLATLETGLTVDLALFGGFNPAQDDFFDVLTADNFDASLDLAMINFISSDFDVTIVDPEIVTLADGGGTRQALRLTFTSAVPVPAAMWLFASALFGLLGLARRTE